MRFRNRFVGDEEEKPVAEFAQMVDLESRQRKSLCLNILKGWTKVRKGFHVFIMPFQFFPAQFLDQHGFVTKDEISHFIKGCFTKQAECKRFLQGALTAHPGGGRFFIVIQNIIPTAPGRNAEGLNFQK